VRDGRLSLHDLITGENRVLASEHDCAAESPVFTPDGKRIAYFCYTRAADKKELKIMTLDGSNIRAFPYDFVPAAVTPDSQVAAGLYYRDKEFFQIALVNLSTGKLTVLKSLDWRRPEIGNFSPDGRYLVYSLKERQDSQDQELYSLAIDGSSETKLISESGAHRGPLFTPNGSRVVFTSNRSGRWDLWSIRVAGGKAVDAPELAKTDIGEVFTMGFSQGGSLYFVQEIVEQEAYTVEVDPATWRITGGPKRVSDRPINNTAAPQWSPDGKWLAFLKLQPDPGASRRRVTFVVRAVDSSQEREFPVPFGNVDDSTVYSWFRDSRSLMLVQHTAPSQTSFLRLDIESGQVRPLFNPPLAATPSAGISQDGRAIVYGGTQLISRNIETGEERMLAKAPHSPLVWPTPSPDGRHVAFFSPIEPGPAPRNFSISYVPGSGGEPREVWRPTDGKWSLYPVGSATGLAWTPDSRGLLCVVYDYAAKLHEILRVPLDGSEPRTTGIAMPEVSVSSIRPDGRRIGYTGGGRSRQVWMLDNLFPETSRKR
jgi:Tol biopolymer transport system component